METIKEQAQIAIDKARAIDNEIRQFDEHLGILLRDLKGVKRMYEAGVVVGLRNNLRDSFFAKSAGLLEDMADEFPAAEAVRA